MDVIKKVNHSKIIAYMQKKMLLIVLIKFTRKKVIRECMLFVVRIPNCHNYEEDELKMSKPCLKCASKIRKTGILTVYYSVDDNYVNDFLYRQIIKFNNI